MAPDTFHPYPGLPDELKVQIWKHAIGPPAAHHFKLNLPDDFSDLMVMTIEPIAGPAKDDPSIWRDTWSYSAADTVSHQLLAPENQLMVWQRDKSKQERIDKAVQKKGGGGLRYGSKALINASRDLVHFKFTGDEFDPWSLSRLDNRKLLKGIQRVAFDWKPTQHCRKGHWIIRPFECMCNIPGPHMWQENCHRSIAKFLSLFADLETFYFIIEVRRVEIDETWLAKQVKKPEPRGTKRARNGKAKFEACQNFPARLKEIRGKPAPELIEETIAVFREAAKKHKNLDIFHDKKAAYYEVRRKDTKRLKKHNKIWTVIEELQKRWRSGAQSLRHTKGMRKRAEQTKFKVLVYEDLSRDPKKDREEGQDA